jgi:hypothetical protein
MITTARKLAVPTVTPQIGWIATSTFLAWLGVAIHNRADLPELSLLSPETSIPALIYFLLLIGIWLLPRNRMLRLTLLSWAWVNLLAGGIVSVIPFPFLPFYPEQTAFHYLMHMQYVLTQIPLIVVLLQVGNTLSHQKSYG